MPPSKAITRPTVVLTLRARLSRDEEAAHKRWTETCAASAARSGTGATNARCAIKVKGKARRAKVEERKDRTNVITTPGWGLSNGKIKPGWGLRSHTETVTRMPGCGLRYHMETIENMPGWGLSIGTTRRNINLAGWGLLSKTAILGWGPAPQQQQMILGVQAWTLGRKWSEISLRLQERTQRTENGAEWV